MTDYDVSEDVAAVVEDTDLPQRLKNEVYETVEARDGVTVDQADQIARAVENRYLDTRVDPLDPVGVVSAQSIGEPGTQMSIPADESVLVRRDGETRTTEIGPLVDNLMASRETRELDGHEVALAPDDLEVVSLRDDERVSWKTVEEISRHETPDELLEIELESGRSIRATKSHSFVTRQDNEVVPVTGDDLDAGDWIPVVGDLRVGDGSETADLREFLPADDYWYTSTLTDGGVETLPGGDSQIRNKRQALEDGELKERFVYPVQGTTGLPEQFPLDEETGFFVGAWLAEGSLTDYYVSVSNVDSTFQNRVRTFAERFGLSVNEYENTSGFADGYDIRVNGKVLADFLRVACTDDGEKVVPGFAFGASSEFVRGLLTGYFSGDGNVGKNSVRASSTSDRLTEGVAFLLARFGLFATLGEQDDSKTLRLPKKHVPAFEDRIGMVGERGEQLAELAATIDGDGPDATDMIPNFGDALEDAASAAGIPQRQVNSATKRQRIGRRTLAEFVARVERRADERPDALDDLEQAVSGDVIWDRIESIETVESDHEYVYDFSVEGLETFTTASGVVTHNTMNTFHYAGVAEIDVTQGLPRLIELVDARKTPDTPMMTVYLEDEYATDRERAHEVVWQIEATKILALGDISTNVADMVVSIDLNPETLEERWPLVTGTEEVAAEIAEIIQDELGVTTKQQGAQIQFGPDEPSYRDLLQLVEDLREITFKGIEDISRVVIRKEQLDDGEEFVLYTEGSAFGDVIEIEGVDASRTTSNNIHEIHKNLGIEAAREAIIEETKNTLEEQGLDDVNIRHLMLVADIMTNRGTIESIGRHGIAGQKDSVLARAAYEVTVNHLLDAAIHGEVDDLNGVIENVIAGKPVQIGTGDVDLRMGSLSGDEAAD
ncbi:DNA-directed RNA polymerase subunit A'' [Halorussus caseinilyticus]|uniref:DNA-directed RNA polymerase subunit A'' n=1 Tax=Halorussus caseinilyticus TaxID=3034025 RepID=UPI0023E761D6|nr:DNA-directed RNA polymerase subunit A'' [Halorussus sp. DT72]